MECLEHKISLFESFISVSPAQSCIAFWATILHISNTTPLHSAWGVIRVEYKDCNIMMPLKLCRVVAQACKIFRALALILPLISGF